jgi:hypothetical protein
MLYQIPQPTRQVDQGATKQQWYVFPQNQPNQAAYAALHANRYVVDVTKRFDGATKLSTDPIPPVGQPELIRYNLPDENRYMDMPVKRFDGATKLATFPVPPVSQPLFASYIPDFNRVIDANDLGRQAQLDGATKMRTDPIPPVSQPLNYSWDANRFTDYLVKRLEGATTQPTNPIPPVSLPLNYSWDVNRYMWGGPKQMFDGVTKQQTFPISSVSQPFNSYWDENRYVDLLVKRFEGSSAAPAQTYVFTTGRPVISSGLTVVSADLTISAAGATTQQTAPIPPTSQPLTYSWDANRFTDLQVKRFEGVASQQTYVFFPNQPELNSFDRLKNALRFLVDAKPQFDGSTKQQTYIFPISEPEYRYYTRNTFSDVVLPPSVVKLTQTDLFPLSQPLSYVPGRQQPKLADYQFVAIVDYIPMPVNQPQNYTIQFGRYNQGTITPIGGSVPVTIKSYYTGHFANQKRLTRGLGW